MEIKILGSGCSKCKTLEKMTKMAISDLAMDVSVERIEDIQQIMQYGVMITPGLVINEKLVLSGKVPKLDELKDIITQNI